VLALVGTRARHAHMVLGGVTARDGEDPALGKRAAGANFHNGLPSTQAQAEIMGRSDHGRPCSGWGAGGV
jgi:hypothetical protein